MILKTSLILTLFIILLPQVLAANFPLEIIQPQEGLNQVSRYYKAYPGLEYRVPIGVYGGAYPFTYSLQVGPSGMTIDAQTGIINWPTPISSGSPHTVSVRVTDQEGNTDTHTWTITVTTQGFLFIDANNGVHAQGLGCESNCGTGTIDNPFRSILDVYRGTDYAAMSEGTYANHFMYFREGTYGIEGHMTDFATTGQQHKVEWRGQYKPKVWLAYPGEDVIIDHNLLPGTEGAYIDFRNGDANNAFIHGFRHRNMLNHAYRINGNRVVFFENHFENLGPGVDGHNTAFILFTGRELGSSYHMFVRDNIFDNRDGEVATFVKTYGLTYSLIENNQFLNLPYTGSAPAGPQIAEGLALKHADQNVDVRSNLFDGFFSDGAIDGNWNDDGNLEIRYNKLINSGTIFDAQGPAILMNHDGNTRNPVYIHHNTFEGSAVIRYPTAGNGPIYFNNNVLINDDPSNHVTVVYGTDPSIFIYGDNLAGRTTDNIIDSNGELTPAYSQYLGVHGHHITGGSSGPDTTPPSRSNGAPSGTVAAGTTQTTISLTTNEASTCRYSTTPSIAFASMTITFTTTGSTAHSRTITGLTNGQNYNYYIRCIDNTGNVNTNDYTITFTISIPDNQPPSQVTGLTATAISSTQINLAWKAATDNTGVSGYRIYRNGINIVNTTSTTYSNTGLTSNTTYSYTVNAYDASGNQGSQSTTASATTQPQATGGLVAHYTFDEGTGTTANDATGNGRTGTILGATWTTSRIGIHALNFDGNDRVSTNYAPPHGQNFTYSAWLNQNTRTGQQIHLGYEQSNGNGFGDGDIEINNQDGQVPQALFHSGSYLINLNDYTTQTWHMITFVRSGNSFSAYVNGQLQGTVTGMGTNPVSDGGLLSIGGSINTRYFNGMIDDVRIYDRALSQNEIQNLYNSANTRTPLEGDVNTDGTVNILDINSVVAHFGKTNSYPSNVNLAPPPIIDLFDVMIVIRNWGRTN